MAGTRLDPIDRKILAELQADGRMTNVELAKRVGISAPPCLRRVRQLEARGVIARPIRQVRGQGRCGDGCVAVQFQGRLHGLIPFRSAVRRPWPRWPRA